MEHLSSLGWGEPIRLLILFQEGEYAHGSEIVLEIEMFLLLDFSDDLFLLRFVDYHITLTSEGARLSESLKLLLFSSSLSAIAQANVIHVFNVLNCINGGLDQDETDPHLNDEGLSLHHVRRVIDTTNGNNCDEVKNKVDTIDSLEEGGCDMQRVVQRVQ